MAEGFSFTIYHLVECILHLIDSSSGGSSSTMISLITHAGSCIPKCLLHDVTLHRFSFELGWTWPAASMIETDPPRMTASCASNLPAPT